MKDYSIFDYFGYTIPMGERYKLIYRSGFDSVSLGWAGYSDNPNETKHLNPELARKVGLKVENIHTPFEGANKFWMDLLDGEAYLNSQMSCIHDCSEHSIQTMVLHISQGAIQPDITPVGIKRLNQLVEEAERYNINLAFENMRDPKHLRYILENIKSDRVKFCFDSGHQNCRTPDEDIISLFGDRIAAVHLHDNDGINDQHDLPFDGTVKWKEIMNKLKDVKYTGATALEVINNSYHDCTPQDFLKLAYGRAKRLSNL